jgi:hypothetical protein
MARFVLLFHGRETPEQPTREDNLAWLRWFGWLGEDSIVDWGSSFSAPVTIESDGTASREPVPDPAAGFTIIEAPSLHDAVLMANECPVSKSGGSVRIYEAIQMG